MPDEDRDSGDCLVLNLRTFWRLVKTIYTKLSILIFIGLNSGSLNSRLTHGLPLKKSALSWERNVCIFLFGCLDCLDWNVRRVVWDDVKKWAPPHLIFFISENIAMMHCWCKSREIGIWVKKKKNDKNTRKLKKKKKRIIKKRPWPQPWPRPWVRAFTDTQKFLLSKFMHKMCNSPRKVT